MENPTMKTLILAVLTALPLVTLAADGDTGAPRGARLDCLQQQLDLSDAQREQVQKVFEERRAKHEALRAEARERMAEVLNADQLAKLDTLHEARKQRRAMHRGKGDGRHKGRRGGRGACAPVPGA
jgi:Spy/CpxP family protein refolding chaperone